MTREISTRPSFKSPIYAIKFWDRYLWWFWNYALFGNVAISVIYSSYIYIYTYITNVSRPWQSQDNLSPVKISRVGCLVPWLASNLGKSNAVMLWCYLVILVQLFGTVIRCSYLVQLFGAVMELNNLVQLFECTINYNSCFISFRIKLHNVKGAAT